MPGNGGIFHSTIETLGGITTGLIALVLFLKSQEKLDAHLVMPAIGFAGMGILDTAHAISRPGDAFIFLHSVASLCGGVFFASVFRFHRACRNTRQSQNLLFASLAGLFGVAAVIFPFSTP